jgi:hypothetical protein
MTLTQLDQPVDVKVPPRELDLAFAKVRESILLTNLVGWPVRDRAGWVQASSAST